MPERQARQEALRQAAAERILLLDTAMGTAIQAFRLGEEDFRGRRFADHPRELKGNNDLLCLTRPKVVREIHLGNLEAGADIVETNSFNSTAISQTDYGMAGHVLELNGASARLAREAADDFSRKTPDKPRFVAGVLGPTSRTASLSPDVEDPGYRNVTFDELVRNYREAAEGLMRGGADLLLVETVFDTLNARAALFAIDQLFEERKEALPIMVSGTITDLSGRTLSGQTPEAFWYSIRHARPFSVGLNCALGPKELRPHIAELSRIADTLVSAHPNAGLPNQFGGYDLSPEVMAEHIGEWAREGLINIVGGCCGTTADHLRAIAAAVEGKSPRNVPQVKPWMRLSGLEPFVLPRDEEEEAA